MNELVKDYFTINNLPIPWNIYHKLIINSKFTCALNIFIKKINRTLDMPQNNNDDRPAIELSFLDKKEQKFNFLFKKLFTRKYVKSRFG